jgi:DNA polymerase III alpha subunit
MKLNKELISQIIPTLKFNFPYNLEEYSSNPIMENFHYHTSYSNVMTQDSPVSNEDYAKRITELNGKCLFSGEHGWQGNVFEVHDLSEKYNLKYRHSVEAYWVKNRLEKDRTNCHINLIAKNNDGKGDINFALSEANVSGYYGKPRIDLELLFNIPKDNIIVTSACVAGWNYENAKDIWLKIWNYFGDNFFLEIQNHNTDLQKRINETILEISEKYGIQIIDGLDSHYINKEKDDIKREKLLEYSDIHYADEDGWNLDYPNINTVIDRLHTQNILNDTQIYTAIMNTNIFNSDSIEDIKFDRNFKIPNIYKNCDYNERVNIYKSLINKAYKKEKNKSQERIDGIRYEAEQVIDSGVVDYFLDTKAILDDAINNENGKLTTTSRGSMASFYTNKLLGFTTIDRFNAEVPIYPERFLTKERVLAGQMPDCDFNIASQEPFRKAAKKILGEHGCYPLMAIEKLKPKNAWKMYASINNVEPTQANEISKCIDNYEEAVKNADDEFKEDIDVEDYIPDEYKNLFNKSIEYRGIVTKIKVHTCGHLLLDGDIRREIGLISAVSKSKGEAERIICAACEGSYLDSYGYVKEDFLIVDAVSLINEYWESINKPIPTFDELRELIKDDDLTWGVYAKGITCCVNQMEKQPEKCKKFKPSNLAELAGLIAGIRPGFKSLINIYINRQPYTTGEEGIDNLLKESSHFMIFQESIMRVLGYLSVSMRDTYGVIKSISKKKLKGEKKEHLLNQLKNSWKDKFSNTDNFNNVWKVISDAARYSFNAPHALSMAGDSAYIAYFKAHYTSKFYEVSINHYLLKSDKDKMNALITEASQYYGYKLGNFKFGQDNRLVHIDDNNKIIYSSLSGIKGMQNIVPQILFDLGKEKYKNLFYLFQKLLSTNINKKSLNILINLNYFSDYGDINYINQQLSIYKEVKNIIDKLYQAKQINKKDISNYGLEEKEISKYCNKETDKQFREINNEELKKYLNKNYNKIINYMTNKYPYKPCELMDIMKYQVYYLGQTNIIDSSCDSDIYIVQSLDVNNYGTAFAILYQCCSGQVTQSYKIDRKWYAENPCQVADIIRVAFKDKFKHVKVDDKWVESNDVETIISNYFIMERVE